MTLRTLTRLAVVLSITGLVATGCGRRGDLDPPNTPIDQQNKKGSTAVPKTTDKPFILDPLL